MSTMKNIYILVAGICAFLLVSCLDTVDPIEELNIFALTMTLLGGDQVYVVDEDSIIVLGYEMFIDSIGVVHLEGHDESINPQQLWLASHWIGRPDESSVGFGEFVGGVYNGVSYAVVNPSSDEVGSIDTDLVERDEATGEVTSIYSIAVTGAYNGQLFLFRSKLSEKVQYGFYEVIEMPEFNGYLEVQLRGNWRQWFLNAEGNGILNPNDPSNRDLIEENILKHFDVLTFKVG